MPDAPSPDLQPVADDGVGVVTVGLVLWALAAVGTLLAHEQLSARDLGWWTWTALVGLGIGLFLRVLFATRAARIRRRGAADGPGAG